MRWSIGAKIWAGYGIALLLLLVIGAASARSIAQLVGDADAEAYSSEVLEALSGIESARAEAELAERQYLTSGDAQRLDSHTRATARISQRLAEATERTRAEPAMQQQLSELARLLSEERDSSRAIVALRRSGDAAGAAKMRDDARGRLAEPIASRLSSMAAAARAALLQRRESADISGARARELIVVVASLSVVGLLIAAYSIARSVTVPVRASVETLAAASTQLNAASEEHRRTVSEQSAAVNETTATAAELAAAQKQVMQTAATVARSGMQAADAVASGQQALARTLEGLNDIKVKTEATTRRIGALSDRSQQVGKIIGAIKDVAEQTNLLALNAAIEAARAGDHGKGFGVVASEIRKLAERTKRSTEDITDLIEGMQNSTHAAVMATEETLKSVDDGNREAVVARQVFENLSQQVSDTSDAIKQIHISCQQQDAATGQISAAMNQINAGMKQTVAAVEQTVASSSGLTETAQRLKSLVG